MKAGLPTLLTTALMVPPLTTDVTEPAWNGYLLTVARSCGVVFQRWVTSLDARQRPDFLGERKLADARRTRAALCYLVSSC